MSEVMVKLLELIKDGNSLNEISAKLGLTRPQIYHYMVILENKGFQITRKYFYNGDIVYNLKTNCKEYPQEGINLYTNKGDMSLDILLHSDCHYGSVMERADRIDKLFDYAVSEGINVMINAGDFFDGTLGISRDKTYDDPMEQVEYAINRYPRDKNITTFMVLGNHDLSILSSIGMNPERVFLNKRHDIVPLGYGLGQINIKNDKILVMHKLSTGKNNESRFLQLTNNEPLVIKGHSHKTSIKKLNGTWFVTVPTTCDDNKQPYFIPGAIRMTLTTSNGFFQTGIFEQLIIDDKVLRVNEVYCNFQNRKKEGEVVLLEEDRGKKKVKKK